MINDEKKSILKKLIDGLTNNEVAWVSGYLYAKSEVGSQAIEESSQLPENLTLIYVTETGNSKFLSEQIAKELKTKGIKIKIKDSNQYRLKDLPKEENLGIIASTHGEGEVPASGKKLMEFLNEGVDLSKVNYFVIGLGDSSYPKYCQSGKDIEILLEKNKAKKIFDRIDLDLDFESKIGEVISIINKSLSGKKVNIEKVTASLNDSSSGSTSGKISFTGEILTNINLNDIGSSKETRHIEIAIPVDVSYEPGDALAVVVRDKENKNSTPRLYSISSSLNEHGQEVHITVSVVKYKNEQGEEVHGLASGFLSSLKEGDEIELYISKNRKFKLPEDEKDVIMIGPGTGIAPFRGFLAERNSRMSTGKNWLFFGERNFRTDFLYQTELQSYLSAGLLTKLSVAFSRDQEEKLYVQNRILENDKEFFEWIQNGAYIYICGDKEKMARDVENAICEVISKNENIALDQAREFLGKLELEGRYLKDVY